MAKLAYIFDNKKHQVELKDTVRIGRNPENELSILDTEMSRNHAIIRKNANGYSLEDTGSRNGIIVDGNRVSSLTLENNTEFTLGVTAFTFMAETPVETIQSKAPVPKKGPNMKLIGQGTTLGQTKIEQGYHRSGVGHLFKGYQSAVMRTVALKVIDTRFTIDPTYAAHFEHVVDHAKSLNNPNLVRILGAGEAEGYYYIEQEWVDGESASDILQLEARLDILLTVKSALAIIDVLKYLSGHGTIYGNIRPNNIMIRNREEVKLLGAGLFNVITPDAREKNRSRLELPYYHSPEQVLGKPISLQSDIYSLGATLYFLLTGRNAFSGNGYEDIAQHHINSRPILPSKFDYMVPQELEILVMKMLNKNPQDRPTLGQIEELLNKEYDRITKRKVQAKQQAKTVTISRTKRNRIARKRRDDRFKLDPIVGLAILALGFGALVMLFAGGDDAKEKALNEMANKFEENAKGPKVRFETKVISAEEAKKRKEAQENKN